MCLKSNLSMEKFQEFENVVVYSVQCIWYTVCYCLKIVCGTICIMQVSERSMLHCHMTSSNCMFNLCGWHSVIMLEVNVVIKIYFQHSIQLSQEQKLLLVNQKTNTLGNCHLGDGKPTQALCIVGKSTLSKCTVEYPTFQYVCVV